MKLTKKAAKQISNKTIRTKLALALETTDQSIRNYIKANKNNGPLTTFTALKVIKAETDLKDAEILEGEPVPSL
jgi:hypothetical protein